MKKIILWILICVMLISATIIPAAAETKEEKETAEILYSWGLFLGYGNNADGTPKFGLDDALNREQALILLLRMLGKGEEAEKYTGECIFSDVSDYARPWVSYAYDNKITYGTSKTKFSGKNPVTAQQFVTFCLRALGYKTSTLSDGSDGDFRYEDAVAFARSVGISTDSSSIDRGDAVLLMWQTLSSKVKGTDITLAAKLIADGVFNPDEGETGNNDKDKKDENNDSPVYLNPSDYPLSDEPAKEADVSYKEPDYSASWDDELPPVSVEEVLT